jgi:hypothetical protein
MRLGGSAILLVGATGWLQCASGRRPADAQEAWHRLSAPFLSRAVCAMCDDCGTHAGGQLRGWWGTRGEGRAASLGVHANDSDALQRFFCGASHCA